MPISIPAASVEQPASLERGQDSRRWWPGYLVGYLPDDLERLRRPDPKALAYPLQERTDDR